MVSRSILIFTKFENMNKIDELRKRYDPLYNKVKPHIGLIFPFDSSISTKELQEHVNNTLSGFKRFEIEMSGIRGTDDRFLFLNVTKGNNEIIELHDRLYTGILKEFLYKGYTFVPHLTIGRFNGKEQLQKVLEEMQEFKEVFKTTIDEVTVEIIDDTEGSIVEFSKRLN